MCGFMHVYVYACMWVNMHAGGCMHECVCMSACVWVHAWVCICVGVCMRVYVYKFYSVPYFSLVKSWTNLHRLENSLRYVLST